MLENAIRAARLDLDFYNTVEEDASFTGQAALLVAIVSALTAIGFSVARDTPFLRGVIVAVIGGLLAWVVWAGITAFIGKALGGTTDFGEMLRVLGYAQAPLALGLIPFLGFVSLVWALVCGVVAIREANDFTTGKAIGTAVLGWLVFGVATWFLPLI